MEITEWQVYWITRCDGLKVTLIGIGIAYAIIIALSAFIKIIALYETCSTEERGQAALDLKKSLRKYMFYSITLVFLFLTAALIPTTKQMCAIKVIPVIANNGQVQELPNKILELSNEWMEELKPPKKTVSVDREK